MYAFPLIVTASRYTAKIINKIMLSGFKPAFRKPAAILFKTFLNTNFAGSL